MLTYFPPSAPSALLLLQLLLPWLLLDASHLYTRSYLSFPEPQVTERISLLFKHVWRKPCLLWTERRFEALTKPDLTALSVVMRSWYGTKRSLIRNQVPLLHPPQTPFHDAAAPCSKRQSYKLSLLMGRIKAGEHAYHDRVSRKK